MTVARRLVFGEVADAYERHRPGYPHELIDDLLRLSDVSDGGRVLEIGAGTGKATAMLVARGASVLAVEPSPAMAAIARHKLSATGRVEFVEMDFERFDPGGERFRLVYAAQAWHWVDSQQRWALARAALEHGGLLAVFGSYPAWSDSNLRAALLDVYSRLAPDMPLGPMHPADRSGMEPHPGWDEDVSAARGLGEPSHRIYRWEAGYTAAEYAGLVGTLSATRLMAPGARAALLGAIVDTVEAHGGRVRLPMVTLLDLAHAV